MQFNIPDNDQLTAAQEGELTCFKIHWPNTPAWRGILAGLLYLVTRGRTWAADSGTIIDAQRAGYRLFEANVPLTECGCDGPGGPDAPGFDDLLDEMCAAAVGGGGSWEDDWMWSVTDVTIEDGKLVLHYGPCCRKVVDGVLTAVEQASDTNPYEGKLDPDTGQPYVGYPCGKATALVNAVWVALDNLVTGASSPATVVKGIITGQPEISFDKLDLWDAYLQYTVIATMDDMDPLDLLGWGEGVEIWNHESILDTRRRETWICRLAARLDNTTTLTDKEIEHLKVTSRQVYGLGMGNVVDAIIRAIGNGDLRAIAAAGALEQVSCDCPELHTAPPPAWTVPTQNGWYWGPVELTGAASGSAEGWNDQLYTVTPEHDVFGVMLTIPVVTGAQDVTIKVMNAGDYGGTNQSIFGNSSDNLRGVTVWGPSEATLNEVMQGYAVNRQSTSGTPEVTQGWSSIIGTPEYAANTVLDLCLEVGWMKEATFDFELRFLRNTGSPSHLP